MTSEAPKAEDYQGYEDWEHVYKVPDMWVGSEQAMSREVWVFNPETKRMVKITTHLPEAVERLFIEILSNAGDNVERSRRGQIDPGVIEVIMERRTISIRNGGFPIPVEKHPSGIWTPEFIFGQLRTSSNYDKGKVRLGCGRNGVGAKVVNIFSHHFAVEVGDSNHQLCYKQSWSNNRRKREEPIISSYQGPAYVTVSYEMDFERFNLTHYSDEVFLLYLRFLLDFSFTCKVPVKFNGTLFDMRDIRTYASLYLGEINPHNSIVHYEYSPSVADGRGPSSNERKDHVSSSNEKKDLFPLVELCVVSSPDNSEMFSYVNGIMTPDGGIHLDTAIKAIANPLLTLINREEEKSRSIKLTLADIKPHISVFLSCRLPDPTFRSQTKTYLTSPKPRIEIPPDVIKPMMKWDLIDRLYAALEAKQYKKLAATDGKKKRDVDVKKLRDANWAGTKRSSECILMLVEGDSATSYGTHVQDIYPSGRDFIGIFPLRGKPLNVLNCDFEQLHHNKEFSAIKSVLGLREGLDYLKPENQATLRYGKILIASDADTDGSHIRSLLMLFFCIRFPSLVQAGFLMYLRTPIIRINRGTECIKFYTKGEYEKWREANPDYGKWKHEYYKGLASTENAEMVKEDFTPAPRCVVCLYDDKAIEALHLAFNEKLSTLRKRWISEWKESLQIDDIQLQPISQYITEELIEYSLENLTRSIPKLMDGLKESQRKVLWGAFQHWKSESKTSIIKLNPEKFKVERLAQNVAEKTNYSHAGALLEKVIAGMTNNFVGTNNLPYFETKGLFGSRNKGGKDCGKARYTAVLPAWWLQYVFKREDFPLYTPVISDGEEVEPHFLLPIIPLGIINGVKGVATAYSTFIPAHRVEDVIRWLLQRLEGEENPEELIPYYEGFIGSIEIKGKKGFKVKTDLIPGPVEEEEEQEQDIEREARESEELESAGAYALVTKGIFEMKGTKVIIKELPIGRWSDDYKAFLYELKKQKEITDIIDHCTFGTVKFEITGMKDPSEKKLRLIRSYGLTNMVLLDEKNQPKHYNCVQEIMETFYQRRLSYYEVRRLYLIKEKQQELEEITNKIKFLQAVISGELIIANREEGEILSRIKELGLSEQYYHKATMSSLSKSGLQHHIKIGEKLKREQELLINTSAKSIWKEELEEFLRIYKQQKKK